MNKLYSNNSFANTPYFISISPKGDVHFKVLRAETFIMQKGKWYFVLGQGTNFMTKEEFD